MLAKAGNSIKRPGVEKILLLSILDKNLKNVSSDGTAFLNPQLSTA